MRFFSIILSLVILQSSFGMYFSKHYCGGHLRTVTLYSEANCCDEAERCFTNDAAEHESEFTSEDCCSNHHIYISSLKAEAKTAENLNTSSMLIPEQNFCELTHIFFPHEFVSTAVYSTRPEAGQLLKLPILFQTFLL